MQLLSRVDDTSPLISYNGDFKNEAVDPDHFHKGTVAQAEQFGSQASFSFTGDSVTLLGTVATFPHGEFSAWLDDVYDGTMSKLSHQTLYNQTLYESGLLNQGLHKVVLQNVNSPYLQMDSIIWTTQIASADSSDTIIESTLGEPYMVLYPEDDWSIQSDFSSYFTSSSGSYAQYRLVGGPVLDIFGTTGRNNSIYSVRVDNGVPQTFNASLDDLGPFDSTLLYRATDLDPQSMHQVTITHLPEKEGQVLEINRVVVYTSSSVPLVPQAPGIPSSTSSSSGPLLAGVTAGIVIATVAVLGLAIWGFFYLRRRRNNGALSMKRLNSMDASQSTLFERTTLDKAGETEKGTEKGKHANPFESPEDDHPFLMPRTTGTSLSSTATYLARPTSIGGLSSSDSHCGFQRAMQNFESTPEPAPPWIAISNNSTPTGKKLEVDEEWEREERAKPLSVQMTGSSTRTGTTMVSHGHEENTRTSYASTNDTHR